MAGKRKYRVNEVARIAGVSVRALHHWHAIELLVPSRRGENDYRLYDDDDLARLQQILIGRALGLSLEAIRRSLDDPSFDRKEALVAQRAELVRRAEDTARMIRAIDRALESMKEGTSVDASEIFDGFEAEAKERWGDTDAWKESQRRTRSYSQADWARFEEEQGAIYGAAYAALENGNAADTEEVMDIAERHRLSIDRWFYPCSRAMHAGLADLYEGDARFAANIDTFGSGLTAYLCAAIRANAGRPSTSG